MTGQDFILITRPAEDAVDYAASLQAEGFRTFSESMLKIIAQDFKTPDLSNYQGLIFTSAKAVRLFAPSCPERDMDLFCIGKNTYEQAREFSYFNLHNSNGGGAELIAFILKRSAKKSGKPFLHICGAHVAQPIDKMLAAEGVQLDRLVIYRAEKAKALSRDCIQKIQNRDISTVTFFSRRTAENFITLMEKHQLLGTLPHIKALCISDNVLECVQSYPWAATHVAGQPDRQGMLFLIKEVCTPASDVFTGPFSRTL